jgi:hypothetical protein
MSNHRDPKLRQNFKPENIVKRAYCHGTLTVVDMSISEKNQIKSNQTDKKTRITTKGIQADFISINEIQLRLTQIYMAANLAQAAYQKK